MWGSAPNKHKTKTKFQVEKDSTNTLIIDLAFSADAHLNADAPSSYKVTLSDPSAIQLSQTSSSDELKTNQKIQIDFKTLDVSSAQKITIEISLYVCSGDLCSSKNYKIIVPVADGQESGVTKTEQLTVSF